jgi:hypothetical protein
MIPPALYYVANILTGTHTTQVTVADTIDVAPYVSGYDYTIDEVAISVTSATASSNAYVVIFASDAEGRPSTVVAQSAIIATTAIGTIKAALSHTFEAGVTYWIGIWTSHVVTLRFAMSYANPTIGWTDGANPVRRSSLRKTQTFADAVAVDWGAFSGSQISTTFAPFVLMRIA